MRRPPSSPACSARISRPLASTRTLKCGQLAREADMRAFALLALLLLVRAPDTKVNDFMSYNADTKTVNLKVFAAYNSVQGGFNFNGGSNGSQTITVPAGWKIN